MPWSSTRLRDYHLFHAFKTTSLLFHLFLCRFIFQFSRLSATALWSRLNYLRDIPRKNVATLVLLCQFIFQSSSPPVDDHHCRATIILWSRLDHLWIVDFDHDIVQNNILPCTFLFQLSCTRLLYCDPDLCDYDIYESRLWLQYRPKQRLSFYITCYYYLLLFI